MGKHYNVGILNGMYGKSGRNSPTYGIRLFGEKSPNFKHGKTSIINKYFCIDCGNQVSTYKTKRCRKCSVKHINPKPPVLYGLNNPKWKFGKTKCVDCGKEIKYGAKRCKPCHAKFILNHPENTSAWRGGISFESYPRFWRGKIREQIRESDDRKCQLCGVPEQECLKKLAVHHIDYDKKNLSTNNLISLCHSCHAKTNFNRDYWKNLFNRAINEKGEYRGKAKDTRPSTYANLSN